MPTTVTLKTAADVMKLEKRLQNPERLLTRFGAMLAADAKASFDRQALGEIAWPERYPGQKPPFLNVAGAISDFAKGRTKPLARRFENRPAGVDTRETRNSISYRVVGTNGVEVGSTAPNAQRMQSGGESSQPITPEIKKLMGKFLKPKKTRASPAFDQTDEELAENAKREGLRYKPNKKKRGTDTRTDVEFTIPSPYRDKLGPLFHLTTLKTQVHARPFLGVTDAMRADLLTATEDYFATGNV